MRICRIKVRNYRTLESCDIKMPDYYTAVSGRNNAGKSNLLRVIRAFFVSDDEFDPFAGEAQEITHKADFPLWKRKDDSKEPIELELEIRLHKSRDEGLYKFVQQWLGKICESEELHLSLGLRYEDGSTAGPVYLMQFQGEDITDNFKVREIHKRIKTSKSFIFHNSTQPRHRYYGQRSMWSLFGSVSPEDKEKIKESKDQLFRRLNQVAAKHKVEIAELLGRLEEKYEISMAVPAFDFESFPFVLSLGDKKDSLPLDDFGSGTQNRTSILLALMRAKKVRDAGSESDRITPIIVIEEAESFLHPSAQAEFGRLLRDLAREFEVQVISTTHSPHMLSVGRPDANILLSRRQDRSGRLLATFVEDTTGDEWMKPFALALGVTSDCFGPWRAILFAQSDELLLCEGEIDKRYFEALQKDEHGDDRLDFKGEVFPYGGEGFFAHDLMVRFILNRFSRVVITFDLDVENRVSKVLERIGLKKGEDFFAVGQNAPGRRAIEGLLPMRIMGEVAADDPHLITLAASTDDGNRDAKQKLKTKLQEKFLATAKPRSEDWQPLYSLGNHISKAFKKKRRP